MLWTSEGSVIEFIIQIIRVIVYALATGIYQLIIWLYSIFTRLSNSRILDSELLKIISERIGIVLGIVMLFMIVFSTIQMILEPDKLTDKEKGVGNIIKKVILVIVMLGVSSSAFRALYGVQKLIINSNVISKFILPYEIQEENFNNFGAVLSAELFTTFYRFNEDDIGTDTSEMDDTELLCYNHYNDLKLNIREKRDFWRGYECLNKRTPADSNWGWIFGNEVYIMKLGVLDTLLLLGVGLAAAYFLFSYCLSVGTRTVQLAFLEIISPMAIVSYLSPKKDTMFQKWWKIYFSTYIDVFLRVAIISLAVFLIATIFETESSWAFWASVGQDDKFFISTFMIMAILMFAKKAPDLIKELFPSGASKLGLGITSPKKLFDSMAGWNTIKSITGNTVGLLGKKTLAGFDAKFHGQKFSDGWKTPRGKIGQWFDKQRETYLPNYNDRYKKAIEGSKEVEQINTKWNKGVEVVEKLRSMAGADYHSDSARCVDRTKAWDKVLNGETANRTYYEAIFDNDRFIESKMAVDKESSIEDDLRRGNQQIMAGGDFVWNGTTYGQAHGNVADFTKEYENQQKKVEGLKAVHDSMRKQYHKDAMVEDQYKFIKNNKDNPATLGMNRVTRGIE